MPLERFKPDQILTHDQLNELVNAIDLLQESAGELKTQIAEAQAAQVASEEKILSRLADVEQRLEKGLAGRIEVALGKLRALEAHVWLVVFPNLIAALGFVMYVVSQVAAG